MLPCAKSKTASQVGPHTKAGGLLAEGLQLVGRTHNEEEEKGEEGATEWSCCGLTPTLILHPLHCSGWEQEVAV